jgi:PAS domain S-box-containing protein
LGRDFLEVWSEVRAELVPVVDLAYAGEPVHMDAIELLTLRKGYPEETHFAFSYTPVRDETGTVRGFFCPCAEITEKVLARRRQEFRLAIEERLRKLDDPDAVMTTAVAMLAEHLATQRVGYGEVLPGDATMRFSHCYARGVGPLLDDFALDSFGPDRIAWQRRGETEVCPNVLADPGQDPAVWTAIDTRAFISVPVVRDGRLRASLYVDAREPRRWMAEDVALVEDVAARIWDAVERARAEEHLRDARERYLALFNAIDQGFCTIEVAFDEHDNPVDYRFLEVSPSFERQTGIVNGAGRWMREIAPDQDRHWFDAYGRVALTGEPVRFVNHSTPLGRWWDVYAFRISGPRRVAVLFRDITGQKRAEAALRASEARLGFLDRLGAETATLADADAVLATTTRLMGEHLRLSVCAYADMDADQDGFTIRGDWAAPGCRSIVGHYSLADFGTLAVKNLSAGLPLVVNDNLRELASEEAATFQGIGISATICMPLVKEGRLTALMAIHDRVPRAWTEAEVGLLREVTARSWAHVERVAAVAELRASEARLRLVQTAGGIGSFDYDLRKDEAVCSPEYYALLGLPEGHPINRATWMAAIHPDDAHKAVAALDRAVRDRKPVDYDYRVVRASDGKLRWLSGRAVILFDADDRPWRYVGGNIDITDRRVTEERLRELNETLEARVAERTAERDRIWQTSPDLLAVLSFDGVFRRVNPAWTAILGYEERELVGTRVDHLVHPGDVDLMEKALADAAGGPLPTVENRCRHKDGSYRWISWISAPPENGMIYAAGRHVTAEKERQSELEAAQEQLRQAQKMEAVGQLTGGVAHDFNNLLTIIKSSTELLRRPGLAEERRTRYIEAISDTVDRASKLTGQLLAFARRQSLRPEVFNVARRVEAITEMLTTIVGSRVRIITDVSEEPCFVEADVSQFETALVNMAVNARDAMDGEGMLTVKVYRVSHMPTIRSHEAKRGDFVCITMSDTGTGIPPDKLPQIFEPFFTTKEVGKGTGLGLSQVFGFTKQSGGDVSVQSKVGEGTSFSLYLPWVEAEAEAEAGDAERHAVSSQPVSVAGKRRVLVVEDNVEVGAFSRQLLQDLGYETAWAANGSEALELLNGVHDFDVVFSDVIMPGMSGVELGHEIQRRYPGLPVVLTSGYSHVLVEEGRHGFELVQKPYAVEDLSRVLRRVTRDRRAGEASSPPG